MEKRTGKTKSLIYKGVYRVRSHGKYIWRAENKKFKFSHPFETEREAAIAYDKVLINNQKEPVNILKKKND